MCFFVIPRLGHKKDASLGGGSHDQKAASSDASSDASNNIIDPGGRLVNTTKNEDVTQAPAEGDSTNHETNARSALASPSSVAIIHDFTGKGKENYQKRRWYQCKSMLCR